MNSDMIIRITKYYRILNRLRSLGLEKVFAHNLADAAGVSAALVRKDFSLLEIYGQKRGGYEIPDLLEHLGRILGKTEEPQNVIIVGCGRIGKALMHYNGFEPDGIRIVAGFDSDPLIYSDSTHPVPVYPISRLEEVTSTFDVQVAIITVPESATSDSFHRLMQVGIRGILNFSPITLKPIKLEDGTSPVVHNMNIALELEQIFYKLQFPKTEPAK
ncbi:MAG: redox-sensing transcriptional repressor Rex [Sphaerochaetaceae bacterium]|nr:redox-sensing transcriptional repressor Rex [Sphaerochaetaceae bacterium]MDD3366460.1 redox-sensing transcriptional repressor Rex [Sphaerochaetaceae bacterium]MDD4219561.1 redox-sensing transcriptional repressor Rex [Sphaerochaetaceae bacterium]MDY0372246.1 redox-sensing transcriptional repressor Rex [Sphaerochaetaceae bacterium]